ncbi:MAG: glutamate--cysteine ligase [bacterium]|nr:glutamate--cysteine ligase [bacterium]
MADSGKSPVVEHRDELVAYLASGCKPSSDWRIGTEHEKFGFHTEDCSPLFYEGERGIKALLTGMQDQCEWKLEYEGENIIGLHCPQRGSVTLEPGGQFELSGAPLDNIHDTCCEVMRHLDDVKKVADPLDIKFLGMGFSPKWQLDEIPVMPKGRYKIMREYMQKVGNHGLDMMFRSSTVQVNLDFSSEADMVKKLCTSLALQPIATALFASSPFTNGKPNGFLSYRSEVWRDTDADRTGMIPFAFEDGMGFERYTDYALDTPMYFVCRGGSYLDASGQSFRDFLAGKLPALPGEKPTLADWEAHLTTLFPEVRIKRYMEMRGADSGRWRELCALPAFWTGLLYDQGSLDAAYDLIKDWSTDERQSLRDMVPKTALQTQFRNGRLLDIAREFINISKAGLKARARHNDSGVDERVFLDAVEDVVEEGRTRSERLLEQYDNEWQGDINQLFKNHAY